ncbi:MAG TPA: glutamyl-tRNA reductase [Capsulimonadaceae bacterium]
MNHTSAPVEVRERVVIPEHTLPSCLSSLTAMDGVREAVLLSTCNRTEIYCVVEDAAPLSDREAFGEDELIGFLVGLHGIARPLIEGHTYTYRDGAAANHLMNVTSGLDSMVLGEYQILAQVKAAYAAAQAAGSVGAILNSLIQSALAAGKRVRTDTEISRGAFSIGSAAVELARQIFGDSLASHKVLILGAGKMSDLTARHLQARGTPSVFVANRTFERAQQLAEQLGAGAEARSFDELPSLLVSSDIVICSTAAPHPVVTRDLVRTAMKGRRNRALFLIDIAVPRDVESAVGDMDNVYLFNIDDLEQVVAEARAGRSAEIGKAQVVVDHAVTEFLTWWRSLEVAPLVVAVRQRLESLRLEEMAKLRAKFPHLSERDMKAVEASMQAYANKVAHSATVAIKRSAGGDGESTYERLDAIRAAFGLEEDAIEKGIHQ